MIVKKVKDFGILIHSAIENGWFLFIAATLGIIAANSEYANLYQYYTSSNIEVNFAHHSIEISVTHWINEFLMSIFFLMVGMEIKREVVDGHLASSDQRLLPIAGAVGGVIVPVLIYCFFNYNNEIAIRAWATPAATDIAFAIGVIGIFGKGLPVSLRIFLTALAIIDDLIAVLIIAIFYNDSIDIVYVLYIAICLALLFYLNSKEVHSKFLYVAIGCVMWYCFMQSGIHATVAGALLGMFIPINNKNDGACIAEELESSIAPLNSYFILPLFAFANSGVSLDGVSYQDLLHPIVLGTGLGLFFGKQIGVFGICYLLTKFGKARLPANSSYLQFYGVSIICGMGFTMSLFIALLAFANNATYLNEIKLGVLIGSLFSLVVGVIVIMIVKCMKPGIKESSSVLV